MKKSKKVLIIIAVVLAVLLVAAYIVLFVLYPEQTKHWTMTAWSWLNEPLPVVGVSTIFILIFAWKVFINSSLGKKQISEFKRNTESVQNEFVALKNGASVEFKKMKEENDQLKGQLEEYKGYFIKLCAMIPNKKVNKLGETIENGKETEETINNETNAN